MATEERTPESAPQGAVQTTIEHTPSRVPPDRPLGLLHQGSRYSYGFFPSGYGIWDNLSSGAPTERFPATKAGRMEGWHRYVELEPGAQETGDAALAVDNPPPDVLTVGGLRRYRTLIILGVIVVAVAAFVVLRNGGVTDGGTTTAGKAGTTATADLSGAASGTHTLTKKTYAPQGLGTLYPVVNVSWSDGSTTLSMSLSQPLVPGDTRTSQVLQSSLTIETVPAGATAPLTFFSGLGECTVHIDRLDEDGFTGTYQCQDLPAQGGSSTLGGSGTLAASGKFEAS